MAIAAEAGHASGQSQLLLRPLRQASRLHAGCAVRRHARPQPPRQRAEGAPGRGDRALARDPRHAGRLAARHRAGLGYRRGRDGAVVAARRPRRRCAGLRELRRGLGHRRGEAASGLPMRACWRRRTAGCPTSARSISPATWCSPGTARPPACACRTATGSPAIAQGLTICDATSAAFAMRLAVGQARCRDLVLAEGAGRRGGARHAGAVAARGGAAARATSRPGRCRRSSA